MLTATAAEADLPRKVVIAYDGFDVGRQMLTWAAKYCLASDDQLSLVQYQVSHFLVVLQPAAVQLCLPQSSLQPPFPSPARAQHILQNVFRCFTPSLLCRDLNVT